MNVGCVLMASGASRRFGVMKNKLLEDVGGRAMFLRTADALAAAGLDPLIVTRSREVCDAAENYSCLFHEDPEKSATVRRGLGSLTDRYETAGTALAGCLFIPGDQPLIRPESIRCMLEAFENDPEAVIRLGLDKRGGSPVIFPSKMFPALMKLSGEQGGSTLLAPAPPADRKRSCRTEGQEDAPPVFCSRIIVVEAEDASELMDVDTPEDLEKIREICSRLLVVQHPVVDK
jgi:molybdenum cofactor cytidylyltransferase